MKYIKRKLFSLKIFYYNLVSLIEETYKFIKFKISTLNYNTYSSVTDNLIFLLYYFFDNLVKSEHLNYRFDDESKKLILEIRSLLESIKIKIENDLYLIDAGYEYGEVKFVRIPDTDLFEFKIERKNKDFDFKKVIITARENFYKDWFKLLKKINTLKKIDIDSII